jgi:hypothetical protein
LRPSGLSARAGGAHSGNQTHVSHQKQILSAL